VENLCGGKRRMLPTGKAKLFWLIDLYTLGHHDTGTFCREFERTYNFEVEKAELSISERSAFEGLFDTVTVYSPFPDELKMIPFYRSAEQSSRSGCCGKIKARSRKFELIPILK
jgi:hypothetical protein